MAVNTTDPTGSVPPPDDRGRVVLYEVKARVVLPALCAFSGLCWVAVSLLYWFAWFTRGAPPVPGGLGAELTVRSGIIAAPLLPALLAALILPPRLAMDGKGICLRRGGGTAWLSWSALTGVELRPKMSRDEHGRLVRRNVCRLRGGRRGVAVPPVFGVSPLTLAAYIQARAAAVTGRRVTVTQFPEDRLSRAARLQLAALGIAAIAGCAAAALAWGVLAGDDAALRVWRALGG